MQTLNDRLVELTKEARDAGYMITWWSPEEVQDVDVHDMEDVVVMRGNDFIEDSQNAPS